ncbi:unnamed protein product [Orchesella dallaii]|uniref:Cytochrome P450 n=1 Tax=Orchesella dallaii TaxID=48710 RepID=A0ABP1QWT4_9HEXA
MVFVEAVAVILAIFIVIVSCLVLYARWNYGKLEKMGIPVIKPHFLLGSTYDLFKKAPPVQDVEWMNQFGSVFGVYEGRDPQLFICDPELIRLVTVKDSQYFDAKRQLEFNDSMLNEMPDFLPGEKWRVVRSTATPAFSGSKIKLMNMAMIESTQDFIRDIEESMKTSNNTRKLERIAIDEALATMLTDLVIRSCFSIKIGDRFNKNNAYHKLVQDLMSPPALTFPSIVSWTYTFPFLLKFLPGTLLSPPAGKDFVQVFKGIMDERRKSGQKFNDVVDLCIEWQDKLGTEEMKKHNVTEDTIMCEALIFFWVGQDQMSTIISTMLYHLAKNPEIENKLLHEITTVFEKHNGLIEHEHLTELPYLLACINEAARLHPYFYRTERVCTKPWKNEQFGLNIPKGMTIQIPIWAANRHPDYFEEPEKYMPERFTPENKDKLHPYALSSFGHGPRNCPGKRFAMETMHLVSAYLLKDLKFEIRSDSELKFKPVGPWMFAPHFPVYMDVLKRENNEP